MNVCGAVVRKREIVACRGGKAAPARHNFSFSYDGATHVHVLASEVSEGVRDLMPFPRPIGITPVGERRKAPAG